MVGVQAGEGKRAAKSQRDQAHGRHRLVDDGHHRHRERWAHEGDGLHRFSNARHFHTALMSLSAVGLAMVVMATLASGGNTVSRDAFVSVTPSSSVKYVGNQASKT